MSLIRRIIEEEYDKDGKVIKKTIKEEYTQPIYSTTTPTITYPTYPQVTWTAPYDSSITATLTTTSAP